jgi:hypothetical protein
MENMLLLLNMNVWIVHGIKCWIVFGTHRAELTKYNYQSKQTNK